MKYTNQTNIPLPLAVLLAFDEYDHSSDPKTISVTSLLKPIKQIILGSRIQDTTEDISGLIPSRMGTALHSQFEKAWVTNHAQSMKDLGYPETTIKSIRINPKTEDDGVYNIYLEKRTEKKLLDWTVSGQFDFVAEGKVMDLKSTGVYGYINQSNNENYIKQMSIYRWLNQDIIKDDFGSILYWFTDWSKLGAIKDKEKYPQTRVLEKSFPLLSLVQTENFIINKLGKLDSLWTAPEGSLPMCTSKELWMGDSVWKYYKDPNKRARATKNFDNSFDANQHLSTKGTGIVVEVKAQAKACIYCPAIQICNQAKNMVASGTLVI